MPSPTETLEQMENSFARIAAVAKDFESGTDLFAKVHPYELAKLLGRLPEDFESRTKYGDQVSLDDHFEPIYYHLALLEGRVPTERIKELSKRSKSFEAGEVETDAKLKPSEKETIEDALSRQQLEDGGGWIVASAIIESTTGVELMFQAEIGDEGECFGCFGPYQIRDGKGVDVGGLTEGDSW